MILLTDLASPLRPFAWISGKSEVGSINKNGQSPCSLACGIGSVRCACSRASVPKNRQAGALHVFSPSGIVMHVLY